MGDGTLGWEIVYSSNAKKVQYWWNEGSKTCVSLKIKDKKIDGFSTIENKECESRLSAARKVWEGYTEGPTTVRSASLDKEREKLSAQGYKAVYWIKDPSWSPGTSSEMWSSADGKKCVHVVFKTADGAFVKKVDTETKQCTFPAGAKKAKAAAPAAK